MKNKHLQHKKTVLAFIREMNQAIETKANTRQVLERYLTTDITSNITKPFNEMLGLDAYCSDFWQPFLQSFPDLENQPYILIGGQYEDFDCVSFTGNWIGTFQNEWLGIPPTQQPTWIRYVAHCIIEEGKIAKIWYFLDILDIMRQAGFHFFLNRGIEWVPPPPMTGDGIVDYSTDTTKGQDTLDLINAMLDGLGSYDGKTLESMGQERFWDVQNMMWYGPSGIGTTRGLKGFQDNHQVPFLVAFPDRGMLPKATKHQFAQLGDGNYAFDFGFPLMYGSHKGDDWLGLKATGKKFTLRVVDFWRKENGKLKENWVMIDMVDVLEQLGVDVFQLLKERLDGRQ